jgi:hypothetical protein
MTEPAVDLGGGGAESVEGLQPGQVRAKALEFSKSQFGGDIAYKRILSEGAAAVATDGHIEAPAPGVIGSGNFGGCVFGACVQVDTNFDALVD